ncbi:MAG: acyltransferase [Pseudomonadota bacterium]
MLLQDTRARRIIDFFRAVAILLVIWFHVIYGMARLLSDERRAALTSEFAGVLNVAWQALGSELIFLFSGFLVSYILILEYREAGRIAIRPYLWRRAARILPLYYVALVFYALTLQPDWHKILSSAVFLGYILHDTNVIPVGWSMEAMVQVYIVLPVLVAFVMNARRPALRIVVLIVMSVLARVVFIAFSDDGFEALYSDAIRTTKFSDAAAELYFMAWFRATPFLLGLGLAWLVVERAEPVASALERPFIWIGALALGVLAMALSGWLPVQNADAWIYAQTGELFWRGYWALHRLVFAVGGVLIALVLFYAPPFRGPWLLKVLDAGPWRLIAQNIYGIYLFHFLFILIAAVIVFRSTDEAVLETATIWHVLATFFLAAALSTVAALYLRRWIENPAAKWISNRQLAADVAPRGMIRSAKSP